MLTNHLTVAELIEHLQKFDKTLPVFFYDCEWGDVPVALPKIKENFTVDYGTLMSRDYRVVEKGLVF